MKIRDTSNIHFSMPPLIELSLGMQFEPLTDFTIPYFGLLWNRFRDNFPLTESHPPLEHSTERFDLNRFVLRPSIQVFQTPPVPRIWFLNQDGSQLIQMQQDRLIHNWRR